jgi:trehalose transport system permease protein
MSFRKYKIEIFLLIPLLLYLLGFTLIPIVHATILAFTSYLNGNFPSLANFAYIFSHFQFKEAVFNTLFITFVGLTLELLLGFGLALLLLERFRGRRFFRALMLLPLGIPTIVVASNMRYLFDTNGFLNEILYRVGLIDVPLNWLGGGLQTLFSLVIADMWKVTPLVMLILLAGLESIPRQVLEAAEIDGASYFRRIRYILLPLLKPFISMALIIRGIDAFRIFELPLALTGRTVRVMATYSFFEYREFGNPYTSAASAAVLMLMILIAISVYLKAMKQREAAL